MYFFCQTFALGGIDAIIRNNAIIARKPASGIGIDYRTCKSLPTVTGNIIMNFKMGIEFTYDCLADKRKALITYNNVWGNTYNYIMHYNTPFDMTGVQGNISDDPLFFNPTDGDYHLFGFSPCIDAGDPNYIAKPNETDIDGNLRILGGRIDIGVDEFTPKGQVTRLEIIGPHDVRENFQAQYNAIAYYHDGTAGNVTRFALWWVEPNSFATIESGLLRTEDINEPQNITLYSQYTEEEVTLQAELAVQISLPRTLYVPAEYETIQEAVDAAKHRDTVIVADGTYTGAGNRDIDFRGKVITVRSENGPENCIIDCNGTQADLHRGFYFHSGEDANSILNGFTIVNGYSDKGGGICCQESSPTITNCTITGNSAERLGRGGGMCNWDSSSPTVTNCTFSGNSAGYGGGMYNYGHPTVTNCTFTGNEANDGGGMANENRSSPTVTNCTFSGNSATNYGGGMRNTRSSIPTVTNCTFSGNSAGRTGGGMYNGGSNPTVTNCILWGNSPQQIAEEYSSGTFVTYSNVQGGWLGLGNISADPCFAEAGYWADVNDPDIIVEWDDPNAIWVDGDYHLKSEGWRWYADRNTWAWDDVTSPCIDAGNPGSPLGDEPLSVPADPNNDWGVNIRINMGAYGGTAEASIPPHGWTIRTDYNNDGIVNFTDFACWSKNDAHTPTEPHGHLNPDPIDLALLADRWLEQTTWFGTLPPPTQAWNPDPPNGATGIRTTPVLSWEAGAGAISHDIYFGTAYPPPFHANRTETTFDPGGLSYETTYFWRIDEVNADGTTPGPVWTFTTTHGGTR